MAAGGGRELRRSLGDLNVCKNNCSYVSALALLILCRQNGLRVDNLTDISPLNLYYSSWNLYFYFGESLKRSSQRLRSYDITKGSIDILKCFKLLLESNPSRLIN